MCMKEKLIHSRTCVYNINYHVVWSVKYRRKILSAEIEIYLKELVQKGDTILVKASHFMKFEEVVEALEKM